MCVLLSSSSSSSSLLLLFDVDFEVVFWMHFDGICPRVLIIEGSLLLHPNIMRMEESIHDIFRFCPNEREEGINKIKRAILISC